MTQKTNITHQSNNHPTVDHTINELKLKPFHWKIWFLSSMGIFNEGYNLFMIGVALPLIIHQKSPTPLVEGLVGAAAICGTVLGSFMMGRLADSFGRKRFYIMNLCFVIIAAILSSITDSLWLLIAFQFLLGIGIGADYPICAAYVSEFMPSRVRGMMLIATFSFQALGMMAAAGSGIVILMLYPAENAWHTMILLGAVPAAIVLFFRLGVPESPRWCLDQGKTKKAAKIISMFSDRPHQEILEIVESEYKRIQKIRHKALGFSALFSKKYLKRTILSAVPWFLMDISTYGVGIFTPVILASVLGRAEAGHNFVHKDLLSTTGAAFVDLFLVVGFLLNMRFVEKFGRIRLQLLGFFGMVVGLLTLGGSSYFDNSIVMIFCGFVIYNLLMNMGPNATTFILPAELFPTKLRASAHGFSASFAKVGAVTGIILLPVMKKNIGDTHTIFIISTAAILGFVVTWLFQIETTGKSIDELSPLEAEEAMEHKV